MPPSQITKTTGLQIRCDKRYNEKEWKPAKADCVEVLIPLYLFHMFAFAPIAMLFRTSIQLRNGV